VQLLCTTACTAVLHPFRRLAGLNCSLVFCRYINEDRITIYVEHPVPLDPPVAETPAPPMPLMLTAKEKKKIRKQRREEREKERQVCTCSWDGPDCSLLVGRSSVTLHVMHIPRLFACKAASLVCSSELHLSQLLSAHKLNVSGYGAHDRLSNKASLLLTQSLC